MFVVATALPINMGAIAFVAAFILGGVFVDMNAAAVLAGFPGDLFVTLVGITYLFAIAQKNGTVDLLVHYGVRAVGGRAAALPWVMFTVTGLLTSIGAVSPGAVAIIAPIALRFADRYGINPLLMGVMVVHGAQGGGFSPISVFGGITNQVVERAGLASDPMLLFLGSFFFNLIVAAGVYFAFRKAGTVTPANTSTTVTQDVIPELNAQRLLTLIGLLALAVGALIFDLNVGFVAMTVAVVLALFFPESQKGTVDKAAWSTVLLICGVVTYVGVLQKAGTVDWVGQGAAQLSSPLTAALLLCYVAGIVSAFASSTGILGALIPLAVPLLAAGQLEAGGVIAAIGISTTIVDVSPFSTNGALVLANMQTDRDRYFRLFLLYAGAITLIGPLLAWVAFVLI